jgi:copper(I)-binding protein
MNKNKSLLFGYIILFTLMISGCFNQKQVINVEDAWANPGIKGGNSAIFFEISNPTEIDDSLLEVKSSIASAVEIHKTSMVDGVMKMERQFSLPVPREEKVIFKPGDLHVMLIGLNEDLKVGDTFNITLTFEQHDDVSLDVLVREP